MKKFKERIKEKTKKVFNFVKKDKKRMAIFSIWTFLLLGLTLAYVAPIVSDVTKTLLTAQGSKIDELIFTEGATIVLSPGSDNLNQGMGSLTETTEAYATIVANEITNEATMYYSVYLDITENEYTYTTEDRKPELILNVKDSEGNEITSIFGLTYYSDVEGLSGFDITNASGIFRLIENYEIYGNPTSTDEWIITVSMVNLETDQSDNAEKTFSATIDMSADIYDLPNDINIYTIDRRVISNSYVATTTEVTCDSGTASWNDIYKSLEISNFTTDTACKIIYDDSTDGTTLSDYIINLYNNGDTDIVHEEVTGTSITSYTDVEYSFLTVASNDASYPWTWDSASNSFISTNASQNNDSVVELKIATSGYIYISASISNGDYDTEGDLIVSLNGTTLFEIDESESRTQKVYVESTDVIKIEYEQTSDYTGEATVGFKYSTTTESADAGYRYEGKSPDNYIYYNGELWRIIGVMETELADGSTEMLTKIMRDEVIGGIRYDYTSPYNSWDDASLNNLLNGAYLNAEDGTNSGYCYGYANIQSNCDYTQIGISSSYRDMIEEVKWDVGYASTPHQTASSMYIEEISGTSVTGYIGLISASDYGFAADTACTANLGSYSSSTCAGSSWMYGNGYTWTITPYSASGSYVLGVSLAGNVGSGHNGDSGFGVLPVLYLKSSVEILEGDGSFENPYVIA